MIENLPFPAARIVLEDIQKDSSTVITEINSPFEELAGLEREKLLTADFFPAWIKALTYMILTGSDCII